MNKRVFSGVQPTGNLHLGNYLGAMRHFVDLQKGSEQDSCLYCVVDLHAITVPQNPNDLRQSTRNVTAAYLACGIDPNQSIIFNQSRVAAHSELAWIFNCISRLGWLNRMTQFKDKAGKNKEKASVGLYAYPNLMAADILAYKATHVPVGDDQKQHLELCRDISAKFNHDFGVDFFPEPEPLIMGETTRVMSLRDGTKKMSKSDPSEYSRISLSDTADDIAQKIRKAKTDPLPLPDAIDDTVQSERPEVVNLMGIYGAMSGQTVDAVVQQFAGKEFSAFKSTLADVLIEHIVPIGTEMQRLCQDQNHIDQVLSNGAERARAIAAPVIAEVKEIMGFVG